MGNLFGEIKKMFKKTEDETCPLVNCPDFMGACEFYNLCETYKIKEKIAENLGRDLADEIIEESIYLGKF